jgi:ATP-dependent Lon protease
MDVSQKIASEVDESLSRAQKQFFLKQQLDAIQRELHNLQRQSNSNPTPDGVHEGFGFGTNPSSSQNSDLDGGDEDLNADPSEDASLVALKRKIEALSPGSEERKMGAREWKRLKRIPPGSVENGVIRSYVRGVFIDMWHKLTIISSNGSFRFHGLHPFCLRN